MSQDDKVTQSDDGNNNQGQLDKERKSKKIHNLKSAVWNKNKKTHRIEEFFIQVNMDFSFSASNFIPSNQAQKGFNDKNRNTLR